MQPTVISTISHTRGDTWEGMDIGPVFFSYTSDPSTLVQPPDPLSSCRLYFRAANDNSIGFKFKTSPGTGEGTITIDNATTWEITVEEEDLSLSVGNWKWDLETTDSSGVIRTIYKGVLSITSDATYD